MIVIIFTFESQIKELAQLHKILTNLTNFFIPFHLFEST